MGTRLWAMVVLLMLYPLYGAHRALHVLFASPAQSFAIVHEAEQIGTYHSSYHKHAQYTGFIRLWSVTSVVVPVAATIVVYSALQFLFPTLTAPALAASQTISVTNPSDSGAGTLRDAIQQANAASLDTETIIDFNVAGTIPLSSGLTVSRQISFVVDAGAIVIDGASIEDARCLTFGTGSEESTISDVTIQNCSNRGVNIQTTDVTVDSVTFSNNPTGVYLAAAADRTTVTSSTFTGTGSLISLEGDEYELDDVTFSNNTFSTDSTCTSGIGLWGTTNATITGNTFSGSCSYGVDMSKSTGATVTGNTFTGVEGGVDVEGADHVISDNTFTDSAAVDEGDGFAIYVSDNASNVQITGNTITGGDGSVVLDSGSATVIEDNVIADNDGSAIVASGMGTTIRNNTLGFAANRIDALGNGDSDIILGTQTDDNGNVTQATNIAIENNYIGNNANNAALEAYKADGVTFTGNTILGGAANGLSLNSVENFTVDGNFIGQTSDGTTIAGVKSNGIDILNQDGITTFDLTISDNTIAYSGNDAVNMDEGDVIITVTKNNYIGNGKNNININEDEAVAPPEVTAATEQEASGTSDVGDGGRVEVYADGLYLAEDTTPDASGNWSIKSSALSGVSDGAEITALGFDADGNTSEFSEAATFVRNSDDDDNEDSKDGNEDAEDGGSDDDSEDGGTEEDEEAQVSFTYLQPATKDVRINGETVIRGEAVLVNSGKTTITLRNVPRTHRVKVRVLEKDTDTKQEVTVKETIYKKPNDNGGVKGVFTTEDESKKYRVFGTGRTNDGENTSKERKLAAVAITTLETPKLESIDGEFLVTTSLRRVLFDGDSESGRIRIYYGGTFIGGCDPTPCSVPFEGKGFGEYVVKYDTIIDDATSPVNEHRVIIADRVPTDVFNVDPRQFSPDRITTSNSVKVVGVGPGDDNVVTEIEIDDQTTDAEYISDVGFEAEVDLSDVSYGDHTLIVHFYDVDSQDDTWTERVKDRIEFEFKKWPAPSGLLIEAVPQSVVRNATLALTVTGGTGNRVHVVENGELVYSADMEANDDSAQGSTVISFDTSTVGSYDFDVYAEDRFGIRTPEVAVSYDVVTPTVVEVPEETQPEQTPTTETPESSTPETTSPEVTPTPDTPTTSDTTPLAIPTPTDTDGDGLTNDEEAELGTDPESIDSDNDTIPDTEEAIIGTDPVVADNAEQVSDSIRFRILPVKPEWVPDDVTLNDPRVHIIDDVLEQIPGIKDVEVDNSFWNTPLPALIPKKDATVLKKLKAKLDEANTTKNLEVVPLVIIKDSVSNQEVDRAVAAPNETGTIVLNNTRIIGIPANKYTKFIEPTVQETQLLYRGTTIPNAMVVIEINSDPVVRITRADGTGEWSITVPVEAIPAGDHTAFVYSQYQGAQSGRAQIAKFVVLEDEHLSNTSWLLIVNIVLVITLLGVMITLQLRNRPIAAP